MSQTTTDNVLRIWVSCSDDVLSGTSQELLDLRAAVRRVLDARKATSGQAVCLPLEVVQALDALDAEMASIDGNDPVVVERGGPAPTEALQKITEKQIQEGIDAALRGACKSVDELRRQMP